MEEGVRPYARPISCNDCPAFQRRQMSVRCASETSARFPCAINTTLSETYFRWCCIDLLNVHDLSDKWIKEPSTRVPPSA